MALVTTKEMFAKALVNDYAIGAFNVNNMEIIQGIVDAAKLEQAQIILQVSAGARKYAKPVYLLKLVEAAIEDTGIDVALHLDHGEDFDICKSCVDGGFTSVMVDGSKRPFEENIALTKQVVDYAHDHGVVVEAELGKLAGVEDNVSVDERSAKFTDPDEAAEFVARTGVDSLAIAIGTSHGAYKFKGEPYLDFDRLKEIHALIPETPLVLHGASSVLKEFVDRCNEYGGQIPGAQGVPEEMIRRSLKDGICKVNIDTDLRLAMTAEIRRLFVENPAEFDPRKYLGPGRAAITRMVQHKIRNVLNSSGTMQL
ncbi:MAG: class II fructose-1,6-bisphosphate aldolase [Clostridia bacterium]|nr:class II fructose-1,6-bisphosphate aldolase [Bacillota bacterium]MCR4668103.1 class II fructose-1,6-bisphosphate aldolase [Clostridia bacterium]